MRIFGVSVMTIVMFTAVFVLGRAVGGKVPLVNNVPSG
jgi:hypothetical protein